MIKKYECRVYLFCNFELLHLSAHQIAENCDCSIGTIQNWLRKFNIKRKTSKKIILINLKACKYCNQPINVRIVKHTNIERDPKVLLFCCKECKVSWVFKNNSLF